jgi:plasmid stabilization system protein ParE
MAFRVKFSSRALREIGEAREWYELQSAGLGDEFIVALESRIELVMQTPLIYSEIMPRIRRALLPRFPFGVFYVTSGELIHILAVIHDAGNPGKWPLAAGK